MALADADGEAAAFDLQQIDTADENALAAWLADPDAPKVVHGAKEAWHALAGRGLPLAGVVFDTELAAYLCQPDRRAYDLADLAIGYLRRELGAADADDGGQGALDLEIDGTDEGRRAAVRAAAVRDLSDVLDGEIADRGRCRAAHGPRAAAGRRARPHGEHGHRDRPPIPVEPREVVRRDRCRRRPRTPTR